jgi:transcriptional regulator GlxA family with amidase domain
MAMHRVGFVAFANFGAMGLAALSTFEHANLVKGEPVYEVTLLSQGGGSVRSSAGFSVMTEKFGDDTFDTLIVGASTRLDEPTPAVVAFIRQSMNTARRIATSCTGAFALAEAGVLNSRRATTHWQFARELAARYPKLAVDADRIFVVDGPIWTSAGVTATIDLALAMVEKDLGAEIARAVARKMVVYHRRAGGQSQFSTLLELEPKSDRIQTVFDYAGRNLKRPLSVDELATAAALSPRQFSRVFRAETGTGAPQPGCNRRADRLRQPRAHAPRFPENDRPAAADDSAKFQGRVTKLLRRCPRYWRRLAASLVKRDGLLTQPCRLSFQSTPTLPRRRIGANRGKNRRPSAVRENSLCQPR